MLSDFAETGPRDAGAGKLCVMTPLRKRVILGAAAVVVVGVAVAAYWLQPRKLFTNTVVDEAPPGVASAPTAQPVVLGRGELISHEHETTGTASLLEFPDGSRVLRIEDLDTSDGPKLQVVLSDAPVTEGPEGWHNFEDGRYLDLGPLKGNQGNANYPVPEGADLTGLTSVSIWCDRFDVSFGAASLEPGLDVPA